MDLGDFLLQYKNEHNIGNQKLADKMNISKTTLMHIMNKRVQANAKTCFKISMATGIKFYEIMKLRDNFNVSQ